MLDEGVKSVDDIFRGTAIVILTWNELDKTRRCLKSLQAVGYELDRVVLWDNGSSDGTEESITREFPSVIYHRHRANLGVASGRNAAASLAIWALAATHLMFLDNDMVVAPGFLEALCQPFSEADRVAQTFAKVRFLGDPERLQYAGGVRADFCRGRSRPVGYGEIDKGQYDEKATCLPSGGATLVAVSIFRQLDGFDPVFDPRGAEDIDFSYRVRHAGYVAIYVPQALLYHESEFSPNGIRASGQQVSNIVRNWLVLLSRHASLAEKVAFCLWGAPQRILEVAWWGMRTQQVVVFNGLISGPRKFIEILSRKRPVDAVYRVSNETAE
jgi:GT2 family glycosyltransferase